MIARISRKRIILEQIEKCTKEKINCLVRKIEEDGKDITALVLDASALEANLSDFPDLAANPFAGETVAEASGSSQDS